jgi:NADH:ubiquinone oxidoreductase subunit
VDLNISIMVNLKQIFIWWNRQTLGTFLKTLFYGKFVGTDELGNKYYKSKKNERWVIYKDDIDASKITNDWYLWMHHTINELPLKKEQYLWQKKHSENLTGTIKAYRPNKISKSINKKKYETWKN